MSDPKISKSMPASTPAVDDDAPGIEDPDSSFNDDLINARREVERQARQRTVEYTALMERSRDLLGAHERVNRAAQFRPAQEEDDEVARRARMLERERRPVDEGSEQGRRQGRAPEDEETVGRVVGRLGRLMAALGTLGDELTAIGAAATELRGQQLDARARKLEQDVKQQLQLLLSGAVGLSMRGDVRLTFRPIFARIKRWPARVRPGRVPVSDEDFDIFLAWIFAPPEVAQDDVAWQG